MMRAFLFLALASCASTTPVTVPFGFMDGRILCCSVDADNWHYVDLRCGKYLLERVTNFVRLPGVCQRPVEERL